MILRELAHMNKHGGEEGVVVLRPARVDESVLSSRTNGRRRRTVGSVCLSVRDSGSGAAAQVQVRRERSVSVPSMGSGSGRRQRLRLPLWRRRNDFVHMRRREYVIED